MSSESSPDACLSCPLNIGPALRELGSQYVEPRDWLFNQDPDLEYLGPYSLAAITTAITHFQFRGDRNNPDTLRVVPLGAATADHVQLRVSDLQLNGGRLPTPEILRSLQGMVNARNQAQEGFLGLPRDRQIQVAGPARLVLDQTAMSLFERDHPEIAMPEELAHLFDATNPVVDMARDMTRSFSGIDRLHSLDQLPFFVAQKALAACGGMRMNFVPRRFIGIPLGVLPPKLVSICPIGSKRDRTYFEVMGPPSQSQPES